MKSQGLNSSVSSTGSSSSAGSNATISCKVRLFRDEESLLVPVQKTATGEWLLDYVCSELNLVEKYYFGLRYTDHASRRQWLDVAKPILKQVKDPVKDSICFRVRYYPSAPETLREELTRYQLYMQLRRDAYHGRLVPRPSDVPILCALVIQSELGDYEDIELDSGFTKDIDLLPKLAVSMEDKIIEAYKELSGLTPAETEAKFIEKVKSLETYGIDPQPAKDKSGEAIHIGANHNGVSVFQSFRRIKLFKWETVGKCTIDGKVVTVNVLLSELEEKHKKQMFRYKCPDESTAKFLWTNILDQQAFFTLHSHDQAKAHKSGGLFKRSNKFRFSGRCYDEVLDDSKSILRMPPDFIRASSTSLNRSLSIRSSKRNLVPPTKRYSMGAIPHSKSLPVGFNDVSFGDGRMTNADTVGSLNGTDSRIDEEGTPPLTPKKPPREPSPQLGSHVPSDCERAIDVGRPPQVLETSLDEIVTKAADNGSTHSDEESAGRQQSDQEASGDLTDHMSAADTPVRDNVSTGARHNPLHASTPVTSSQAHTTVNGYDSHSSNERSQLGVERLVSTMLHPSTAEPDCILEDSPILASLPVTATVTQGSTLYPPEIVITEDDDDSVKDDDEFSEEGDDVSHKINGINHMDQCEEEIIVKEEATVERSEAMRADIFDDNDPLSESSKEKLKLDLHKLEDTSSSSAENSARDSKKPFPVHKHSAISTFLFALLIICIITVLLLGTVAYVVFESNIGNLELDKFRHSDMVSSFEAIYYKPLRDKLVNLWRDMI